MKVVFFTGAGISVPSGLPTYRGTNGIYTKNPSLPQDLTIDNWKLNPETVLAATAKMKALVETVEPNPAHYAIAKLEQDCEVIVITQNVDDLHRKAGSSTVYELHGNLFQTKTDEYGTRSTAVLFGEQLDGQVWDSAIVDLNSADYIVAVGTSGDVSPANYMLEDANDRAFYKKSKFIYTSLDKPEIYLPFADIILGSAETTVPFICKSISDVTQKE